MKFLWAEKKIRFLNQNSTLGVVVFAQSQKGVKDKNFKKTKFDYAFF